MGSRTLLKENAEPGGKSQQKGCIVMSKEWREIITLSNGEKREIERWQTMSGEIEHIRDIQTGWTWSEYSFKDCIKKLEEYLKSRKPIVIKVHFENGDYLITKFNGTIIEANEYYTGKVFQLGLYEDSRTLAIKVEYAV